MGGGWGVFHGCSLGSWGRRGIFSLGSGVFFRLALGGGIGEGGGQQGERGGAGGGGPRPTPPPPPHRHHLCPLSPHKLVSPPGPPQPPLKLPSLSLGSPIPTVPPHHFPMATTSRSNHPPPGNHIPMATVSHGNHVPVTTTSPWQPFPRQPQPHGNPTATPSL